MATITLNTQPAQDLRIAETFGAKLGLPGNANATQIKATLIEFIRSVVLSHEKEQARIASLSGVSAVDVT